MRAAIACSAVALAGCSWHFETARWAPQGPLDLLVMDGATQDASEEAAELWNASVGAPAFRLVSSDDDAACGRVYVYIGEYPGQPAAGRTEADHCRARVTIDAARADSLPSLIAHELGHTLLVPHSDDARSTMHPSAEALELLPDDIGAARKVVSRDRAAEEWAAALGHCGDGRVCSDGASNVWDRLAEAGEDLSNAP